MVIYPKITAERRKRTKGMGIAGILPEDFCEVLKEQTVVVNRKISTREVGWDYRGANVYAYNAVVPLDTQFPEGIEHRTTSMKLLGHYAPGYNYSLTLTDKQSNDSLDIELFFSTQISDAPDIVNRFTHAFKSLENSLRAEYAAEEERNRLQRERDIESVRLVHPDSFGGQDYYP